MSNLQIPCPACGALFDLEQALDSVDGKRFVDLLTSMPPALIRPLYNYLKLFKPAKQVLSWARALKLLQELAPMIKAAQIKRNGVMYVIPQAHWEQVLTELVRNRPATLTLPLKSHGYLLSILAGQADKQAAIQEAKFEQQRQNRSQAPVSSGPGYAQLVEMAAEKEQAGPVGAALAANNAANAAPTEQPKPRSRPPDNWNPLRNLLPKLPEKNLADRAAIADAERLLADQHTQKQD